MIDEQIRSLYQIAGDRECPLTDLSSSGFRERLQEMSRSMDQLVNSLQPDQAKLAGRYFSACREVTRLRRLEEFATGYQMGRRVHSFEQLAK